METAARPVLSEDEAHELVARLRATASRWRPLLVVGLLLILAGFVALAGYLQYRKAQAEELVKVQAVQIEQLNAMLGNAGQIVARARQVDKDSEDLKALSRLLGAADKQVTSLSETIDPATASVTAEVGDVVAGPGDTHANVVPAHSEAAKTQVPPMAKAVPAKALETVQQPAPAILRLFIHIASESQRPAAEAVAAAWSGRSIGSSTIVVPGIELVEGNSDNSLRCTRSDTCAMAEEVLGWVNRSLAAPRLRKVDLSRSYRDARRIRPGTFEVWFGPGQIELSAVGSGE